jgi:lycopene cyclase domain-containing protein
LPACLAVAAFFVAWDAVFTNLGIWSFNPAYTLPYKILNLPLEEILFFVFIPYACVFTYFCVKRYLHFKIKPGLIKLIVILMAVFLLVAGFVNLKRLYTSVTFLLLAPLLIFAAYKKAEVMAHFFIGYMLILPFFLLSNGVLTGSFIQQPVVLYNNVHNLGVRIFTIPVEDVFYGMLLVLLNVLFYDFFTGLKRLQGSGKRN